MLFFVQIWNERHANLEYILVGKGFWLGLFLKKSLVSPIFPCITRYVGRKWIRHDQDYFQRWKNVRCNVWPLHEESDRDGRRLGFWVGNQQNTKQVLFIRLSKSQRVVLQWLRMQWSSLPLKLTLSTHFIETLHINSITLTMITTIVDIDIFVCTPLLVRW